MKTIKLIIITLLFSTTLISQGFQVPTSYSFTTDADFQKHENTIHECAVWLMANPVNLDIQKRKNATKFLIDYVTASPQVAVELNGELTPFVTNQDFMVIFIASWTKSCLSQNYVNNKQEFTVRATEDVIAFYKANKKNLKKTKKIKKFVKLQQDGLLENHFAELMK